jgi:hypothetical protein
MSSELEGWHPAPILRDNDSDQWTARPTLPPPVGYPAPSSAAGWHPDPSGTPSLRYFDGHRWTAHTAPMPAPAYQAPAPAYQAPPPGVAVAVAVNGGGGGPNHLLHFVLTVLTAGLWLPIWILVAIFGRRRNNSAVSISR